MPVAMEQADKKIFFHLWYSYWLEEMVFILSNKAAAVLRAGALIAAVFSFLLVGFPVLMSLCGLAFFVFSWFCSKFECVAEWAYWQKQSYLRLITQRDFMSTERLIERILHLEETNSAYMKAFVRPAKNKASASVGLSASEHLRYSERLICWLCSF
ncbi:hypothetical protein M8126_002865 [Escherichia coli]|uniref:hypothetical protein n=1 Tax=Escherichia coli TaxID=562 RepID=UPI001B08659E|nr:hypothetical protein [Escherichia coli]EJF6673313.1 hypothetical protein [Escherichia coli]HBA3799148.1 hypothetical protein [Escherichia coli]HBA4000063.1 hypothetical protein [Escherichia coli]HBA4018277.1 hypothetical protein [Escherichia coli]HBA4022592.1 hypothetical protein [Escherichia coli]